MAQAVYIMMSCRKQTNYSYTLQTCRLRTRKKKLTFSLPEGRRRKGKPKLKMARWSFVEPTNTENKGMVWE